jgi:hypothetical protein
MAGPRGFAILLTALPNRVAMPAAAYLAAQGPQCLFAKG